MHRIADAKADAYDFIDEVARLKLMYHIVEQTLHLYPVLDTWYMYIMHRIADAKADA